MLPVADEVAAEAAPGLGDPAVGGELDEICRLPFVEIVVRDEPERHRGRRDSLLEIEGVERESVSEELDDVVLARAVIDLRHGERIA